jgi:hypothetical protein
VNGGSRIEGTTKGNGTHGAQLSTIPYHNGKHCWVSRRAENFSMYELPAPVFLNIFLHFLPRQNGECHKISTTHTKVNCIISRNLYAYELEVYASDAETITTSLATVRHRIMATITQRKTTITIELMRLNQCILGSNTWR